MATPLSVIILTKNEQAFIRRFILSVAWADEVLVVDSLSTDDTQQIARSLGATCRELPWLGYASQRNKAASLAVNDWVMFLDADEIVTPELAESIQQLLTTTLDPADGYYVDRRGDFLGVLLPNFQRQLKRMQCVRIFNRTLGGYDPGMLVHEEATVPGRRLPVSGVLLHWRGYVMDEYVIVFNRYATMEAQVLRDQGKRAGMFYLTVQPILRFAWLYIWKQNWRCGTRGLIHALLKAYAEFIRYAKLWEMEHAERMINPPDEVYRQPRTDLANVCQETNV